MKQSFVRFSALSCVMIAVLSVLGAGNRPHAGESLSEYVDPEALFDESDLAIETHDGVQHRFHVELANSVAAQRRGLMFRDHLPPGHGMLFDFHVTRRVTMWMSNTLISLDMLFADADGRIVYIAHDTTPMSEKLISAPMPVRYVLEVPAGTARRLDLKPGARLHTPK